MLQKLESIEIGKSINLHIIKSNKFKTNLIGVYLQRPLNEKEATKNALISMILNKNTKDYPTYNELSKRLEELYGAIIRSSVVKKGERQILEFKMQLPNEKYIDSDIMNDGLKLLNGIINEPAANEDGFLEKNFEKQKENLREKIEGRINDKMKYAIDRCVENMCEDEDFSVYGYGSLGKIDELDSKALYNHYKNIISTSPIDIFIVGDIEKNKALDLIKNSLVFERDDIIDIPREVISKEINNIKEAEDNFNVNQGKLTLGYRTNIPYESELYESSVLFSNILGGGPNSKLFKNVREKESLCYYIFSKIEKFKSIMLISSGVEFENFEKTKSLINENFKSMIDGDFTEEDIEVAKKSIITSIRSLTDAPNMLMDFYYAQVLSKVSEDIEGIIKKIKAVDKKSIIEAGKQFSLDTIYFLNKEREGN